MRNGTIHQMGTLFISYLIIGGYSRMIHDSAKSELKDTPCSLLAFCLALREFWIITPFDPIAVYRLA